MPDLDAWKMPEAVEADEIEDPLYDTNRDYWEQIDAYKELAIYKK